MKHFPFLNSPRPGHFAQNEALHSVKKGSASLGPGSSLPKRFGLEGQPLGPIKIRGRQGKRFVPASGFMTGPSPFRGKRFPSLS